MEKEGKTAETAFEKYQREREERAKARIREMKIMLKLLQRAGKPPVFGIAI